MSGLISKLAPLAGAIVLAASLNVAAHAQSNFPTRNVVVINPFPAGSALDGITRLVADHLSRKWGKGVIVENIAGAGGNIGAQRFARAEPDGYTLLSSAPGPLTMNHVLYKDTNYDASKFVPLSLLATVANALVVRNSLPAKTFKEYLDYAKANPGKLNYASQGIGSTGYLTARLLEQKAGIQMVHVPYRGAALILQDIAAGHADAFFDTLTTSAPLHRGGKARILAVADDKRSPALPDVPTVAEFVPGFRSITWFGMAAPEGTPMPLAKKISSDIAEVIAKPEVSKHLAGLQMTPRGTTPEETGAFYREQSAFWSKLINDIGGGAK